MSKTTAGQAVARDTERTCPKCGSRDFKATYADLCFASNIVRQGKWQGTFEECAMPSRESAHGDCLRCKHEWRFRDGWID